MDLTGASAVITGGASGIGEASARNLAGLGARCVIVDLQDEKGEAVAKEQGNAFNMKYKMDLDLGFGELRVNFNDWMFRIDESTIINKATINKFGLNIATVTLFFRKKN